jgi:flagellar hook protein FlgE
MVVPAGSLRPAKLTTAFHMDLNLDASAAPGATHTVPVSIYDSLGNSHVISVTFTRQAAANTWDASIGSTDPAITAIAPAGPFTFTFNANGGLQSVAGTGYNAATGAIGGISLTLGNGAQTPQSLDWSPWSTIPSGTPPVGVGRLSQFAQPSASSAIFQDGLAAAQLTGVSIGDGGAVLAQYSNGSQIEVGRLALAAVRNPDSLAAAGNNNFRAGVGTAVPVVGLAGTGGRGSIVGGSLEGSTVDIAEEFSRLIVFQRAYSANARVITTADDISQETIGLKR